MPTTPNGISYPDTTWPDGFVAAMADMATSVDEALDERAIRTYVWADAAGRAAEVGMTEGDTGYQEDTNTYYTYTGSAWAETSIYGRRQSDTTNTTGRFLIQSGIGKAIGAGTPTVTESVTFPVAFSAGTVPVVVAGMIGYRPTGTFNANSLPSSAQSVSASAQLPSNTGFSAYFYQTTGGNLSAANDWYYSWVAIGVPA